MTREEARQRIDLLNLNLERISKELELLRHPFCGKGNHWPLKIWRPLNPNRRLFAVSGYACALCSCKLPLKVGANRCPACNELLESYPNIGVEDIASCANCGFSGLNDSAGILREQIPLEA